GRWPPGPGTPPAGTAEREPWGAGATAPRGAGPGWPRRSHSEDPAEKAFGARAVITLKDGTVIEDELAVADAHPLGERPFERANYVEKFRTLAEGVIDEAEQNGFL